MKDHIEERIKQRDQQQKQMEDSVHKLLADKLKHVDKEM